jgi:alkanesulfonate monooxygenase SsuD/methylene tetrahydromethanopterin reductase-like flavin-dependent oxidoreductase (luciferase family)
MMPDRSVLFGCGLGAWNGVDIGRAADSARLAAQAERDGLDLFTVADHPYFGDKLDAYALLSFVLGQTERITGMVTVTNLACRPAAVLARTITSLSALSGRRVMLGIGAGALWDMIVKLGVPRLNGGSAVRAMEEAITLIRALGGGGDPVNFDGQFYQVSGLDPAAVAVPPIWTGSVGPKSLAVTGRLADGWIPPGGSDWLSSRYRQSRPRIDDAAAVGRDPAQIATMFNFRWSYHGRAARRPTRRRRTLDRRFGSAMDRGTDQRCARPPRGRIHLPHHRRHAHGRGPGPLGHRDRPSRPRSDRQLNQRTTNERGHRMP